MRYAWALAFALFLIGGHARADNTALVCYKAAGTSNCIPVTASTPLPVTGPGSGGSTPVTPGNLTIVPLDISTVTTGGTAVAASAPGHHNKGGFLQNPSTATINLCINEQATASGTSSAGALTCITPGSTYGIAPNSTSTISVVTSDSAHPYSGQGYN